MLQEYRVGVDCSVKEGLATLLPPSLSPGYLPNLCLGQISKSGRARKELFVLGSPCEASAVTLSPDRCPTYPRPSEPPREEYIYIVGDGAPQAR